MKLLLLIVSLFVFLNPFNVMAATKLFFDDFESGTLSKWATTTSGVTNSTDYAHGGTRTSKVDYGVGALQANVADLGVSAPTDEFYMVYWIRIGDAYRNPYLGFKWTRLKHGNVDGIQTEFYLNSETWDSTGHSYQTGTGGLDYPNTGYSWNDSFDDGTWHKVEVFGKYNTGGLANGTCRIWFDGVQRLNDTTYTWRNGDYASDIFSLFYIPSNAGDGSHFVATGDIVYIDDVEIWDGMPDETPLEPVAGLTGVTTGTFR